jgi:cytochrome c
MKRTLLFLPGLFFILSCGNNDQGTGTGAQQTASTEKKDDRAQKGLELAAKNNCLACHNVKEPGIGPAYEAVAERYHGREDQVSDSLVTKVIQGGSGNWGTQLMPPNAVSREEAADMVHYILSLK